MPHVFVTGGVGFIGARLFDMLCILPLPVLILGFLQTTYNLLDELAGSHTVLSLLDHNYTVTIVDNLDNAFEEAYRRMQELASSKAKNMKFIKVAYTGTPGLAVLLWLRV